LQSWGPGLAHGMLGLGRRHCPPAATHSAGPEALLPLEQAARIIVNNRVASFI
jgi:hypothetical protein